MRIILQAIFILLLLSSQYCAKEEAVTTSNTKVGQKVPSFSVTTLDGKTFNIEKMKGKVVLINFFAVWCPPCENLMPLLEKEIWQKYDKQKFAFITIGRNHTGEELKKFMEKKGFTFPTSPDENREVYSLFAKQDIPRTYVIDKEGNIVYQSKGYNPGEFTKIVENIEKQLK